MPKYQQTFPHPLKKDDVARILREMIAKEKISKANVVSVTKEVWTDPYSLDFAMTAFKFQITGSLKINDSDVDLSLDLPLGAGIFKGMIESQIRQQMDVLMKKS